MVPPTPSGSSTTTSIPAQHEAYVHHNLITLRSSEDEVGAVAFDGLTELFSNAANNRFDSNTYLVPDPGGAYWAWGGQMLTWSKWQAAGNDVHGKRRQTG